MKHVLASLHEIIGGLEDQGLLAEALVVHGVFSRLASKNPLEKIIAYAKTIKNCGDYGSAYWNSDDKHVWWTCADSDGEALLSDDSGDPPLTPLDEIEKKFAAIPGVKKVSVESETSPNHRVDKGENWEQVFPERRKLEPFRWRGGKEVEADLATCRESFTLAGWHNEASVVAAAIQGLGQPQGAEQKLLSRLSSVIDQAESNGMARTASVLHSAFLQLAGIVCPHCGSSVSNDGERVGYCDACDSKI